MKFHQLSLFLENQPAHLQRPCQVLAEAGINIRTLCLADAQEFGILRLIVDDWEKAKDALERAGCITTVTEVVAVEVPDRPGGLMEVLTAAAESGQDIAYMYAFTAGRGDQAVLFFRFADNDAAIPALRQQGINVLAPVDL